MAEPLKEFFNKGCIVIELANMTNSIPVESIEKKAAINLFKAC
jgi:hypothetical protein